MDREGLIQHILEGVGSALESELPDEHESVDDVRDTLRDSLDELVIDCENLSSQVSEITSCSLGQIEYRTEDAANEAEALAAKLTRLCESL